MNQWYRFSLVCGFVPLCTGILIFLCWLVTRAHWLEIAGAVTLYAGFAVFFIGVICLAVYFFKARKNGVAGYWKKCILALAVLLVNFPVAATIIGTVRYVTSISTVIIENQSSIKVEDFLLSEQGHVYDIGSVLPNGKLEKKFHFKSEGSVHYSFTRGGAKYEGVMFGYVTGGMGNTSIMVITESGKVKVDEKI
jgi:hypothetical protein